MSMWAKGFLIRNRAPDVRVKAKSSLKKLTMGVPNHLKAKFLDEVATKFHRDRGRLLLEGNRIINSDGGSGAEDAGSGAAADARKPIKIQRVPGVIVHAKGRVAKAAGKRL